MPHPEYTKGQRLGYVSLSQKAGLPIYANSISCSYQLADSFAGIGYSFFVTLAILYFMKLVVYVGRYFRTPWWDVTGFDEQYLLEDRLQATVQQQWAAAPPSAVPQPVNPAPGVPTPSP